jgi:hypothetical protein
MIQPIMNAPARCTRRACRIVKGEARSQPIARMTIASRNSGKPVHDALSTLPNMWLVFCLMPVTNSMMPCARMKPTNQANEMK